MRLTMRTAPGETESIWLQPPSRTRFRAALSLTALVYCGGFGSLSRQTRTVGMSFTSEDDGVLLVQSRSNGFAIEFWLGAEWPGDGNLKLTVHDRFGEELMSLSVPDSDISQAF